MDIVAVPRGSAFVLTGLGGAIRQTDAPKRPFARFAQRTIDKEHGNRLTLAVSRPKALSYEYR